jgi:DNA-directed RNA polymerase subunit RPC12/RpoP
MMNFLEKYYKNTTTFHCAECKHIWKLNFWQWIGTLFHNDITRHRYVKCPRCGAKHWLQAERVVE